MSTTDWWLLAVIAALWFGYVCGYLSGRAKRNK